MVVDQRLYNCFKAVQERSSTINNKSHVWGDYGMPVTATTEDWKVTGYATDTKKSEEDLEKAKEHIRLNKFWESFSIRDWKRELL